MDYYLDHNPDLGVVGRDRLWAHFVLHGHQEERAVRFTCRTAAGPERGLAKPEHLSSKALRLAQRLVVRRSPPFAPGSVALCHRLRARWSAYVGQRQCLGRRLAAHQNVSCRSMHCTFFVRLHDAGLGEAFTFASMRSGS